MTRVGPGDQRVRGPARTTIFLIVLGLVPAVALVLAHRAAGDRAEQGEVAAATPQPGVARVRTPLVSVRRAPTVVHDVVAKDALAASLAPVGAKVPAGSCLTVGVDGRPVYDRGGPTSVLPASNLKLLTAAVALDVLGPTHRYTTAVKAGNAPSGGRIAGDLYLVGGGDPVLGTAPYLDAAKTQVHYPQPYVTSLEALADRVKAAGITRVGRVVGDDSRYDAERFVPSWPASYATAREAGPLGALMVNDAAATLHPLRSTADPATHAATVFTQLLRARGVAVGGQAAHGVAPAGAVTVSSINSRPVSDLVGEMLTTSDANTAELLLKEIGVARGGAGTRGAGLEVVRGTLARWGIPIQGVRLVDGSGLDRGDRLTCAVILAVLDHAGPTGLVAAGLPVAGRTGTLAAAFHGNPAEGHLRAKTGTLTGAKALSGFVDSADGARHISFSYVQNSANAEAASLPIWDALGRVLTAYPQAPPTAELDPEPASPPG